MDIRIARTMLIHTVCILSVILAVHGLTEDGFTSSCDSNNTIFVQKGKVATFHIEDGVNYDYLRLYRGIISISYMLFADIHRLGRPRVFHMEDRFNFTIVDDIAVNVTLQDVDVEDNGMYMYRGHLTKCWELFVLDIWNPQGIQTFEEYRPAFIHATPPASRLVRPRVNATATWLLNGLNYSETTDVLKQDGRILIVNIARSMTNKNVTYRIAEDNGVIHEVNLTISVTYGPGQYLQFSPANTFYTLTSGDILSDITCSTECNPTCQITWDRSGVGNVLRLGQVGPSSSGMYTCTATRNGSDNFVERSIYVEITAADTSNQPFTISLALLGTLQGVTMLCLVVCAVWIYRTSGSMGTCVARIRKGEPINVRANRTHRHVYEQHISTVEQQHYDGIDNTQYRTEVVGSIENTQSNTEEEGDICNTQSCAEEQTGGISNTQSSTEEDYENLNIENVVRPQ